MFALAVTGAGNAVLGRRMRQPRLDGTRQRLAGRIDAVSACQLRDPLFQPVDCSGVIRPPAWSSRPPWPSVPPAQCAPAGVGRRVPETPGAGRPIYAFYCTGNITVLLSTPLTVTFSVTVPVTELSRRNCAASMPKRPGTANAFSAVIESVPARSVTPSTMLYDRVFGICEPSGRGPS